MIRNGREEKQLRRKNNERKRGKKDERLTRKKKEGKECMKMKSEKIKK